MDQKTLEQPLEERQLAALNKLEKEQGQIIDPDMKAKCLEIIYGVIK